MVKVRKISDFPNWGQPPPRPNSRDPAASATERATAPAAAPAAPAGAAAATVSPQSHASMPPHASVQSQGTETAAGAAASPPTPPSSSSEASAPAATAPPASAAAAALPSATPPATAGEDAEFNHEEGSEQEEEKQRKRHRGRKLGDMNVIPELERRHFEQVFEGIVRCKPCTWAGKKDVLVSLYKKDAVMSHLGMKKRALSKKQQQQMAEGNPPPPQKCQHTSNVESHEQHLLLQALQQQQLAPDIRSLLQGAGQEAVRQKLVQFSSVLHHLSHQRPMVAYEQQQELHQLFYNHSLTSIMPRKHWSDNSGWEIAESLTEVVRGEWWIGN